jgi:hypothetical protein
MTSRRKTIERAAELQDSSVSAWYLAVCLMVVIAGGVWAGNEIGWLDLGSGQGDTIDKTAVAAAAKKAAAREAQARFAAQQEARDLAVDSTRQAVASARPAATASATASSDPEAQESATNQTP